MAAVKGQKTAWEEPGQGDVTMTASVGLHQALDICQAPSQELEIVCLIQFPR